MTSDKERAQEMRFIKIIPLLLLSAAAAALVYGCSDNNIPTEDTVQAAETTAAPTVTASTTTVTTKAVTAYTTSVTATAPAVTTEAHHILSSPEDTGLHCTDESSQSYEFTYNGSTFSAAYEPDNWHISDSYLITDYDDIVIICQALIYVHPVHSADMENYRTAEDMAYEWSQHNIAYYLLPDGSWKESAKDVDLDAKDQNKNLFDFMMDKLDISTE